MSEKRIPAELRRLAEREVPNVDLWPVICARLTASGLTDGREGTARKAARGDFVPVPSLSSSYTWTANAGGSGRRMRRLSLVAVLALALVLVAGLVAVLSQNPASPATLPSTTTSAPVANRAATPEPALGVNRSSPAPVAAPSDLVPVKSQVVAPPYPTPASCLVTPYATVAPTGTYGAGYTTTWYAGFTPVGKLWAGLDRAYGGNWYAGGLKVMWLRERAGTLTITGQRLDGPAPTLVADIPEGYGTIGLQASEIDFPVAGCWQVTASAGPQQLRFVVYVYPTGCRQSSWAHDPATPQPCVPPSAPPTPTVIVARPAITSW